MSNTNWNQSTVAELEELLKNKIVLPGTEKYAASREGWAATNNHPAIIILCETTADVQASVVLAGKRNLRLSVRGGGHDWQGRSFAHNGLVIDLRNLNTIEIDAGAKVATIGGGVNALDLTTAADPYDLIAVVGTSGVVGVAGFSLGGGYGLTTPSNGLGVDNIIGAEVVLADGRLVTASETENPDLLWALRGGGGNFGVVTSLRIRLHPAKPVLTGFIMFPLSETETVLQGYRNIMQTAPDELYVLASIMSGPDGSNLMLISPVWYGDPEEGRRVIDSIRKLGNPVMEQITEMRMKDLVASYAAFIFNGRRFYGKTRWMSDIAPEVIAAITEAASNKTSPFSMISFFHLHGAPAKVPLADTAFGLREDHYLLTLAAEWLPEEESDSEIHKKWADDLFELTAPYSLPGGYLNLLGNEDQEQIAAAHGSNFPKLQSVRKKFDPDGVFSREQVPLGR